MFPESVLQAALPFRLMFYSCCLGGGSAFQTKVREGKSLQHVSLQDMHWPAGRYTVNTCRSSPRWVIMVLQVSWIPAASLQRFSQTQATVRSYLVRSQLRCADTSCAAARGHPPLPVWPEERRPCPVQRSWFCLCWRGIGRRRLPSRSSAWFWHRRSPAPPDWPAGRGRKHGCYLGNKEQDV